MQSPSLRLLLAAPGLLARPGCGPTEHVLSLAHALERTGRFRIDLFFAGGALKHQRCVTLGSKLGRASSDSLTLGLAPWRYLQHLLECRRVARALGAYDVVIERIWGFGGWLARSLAPRPRLVVFEENGPLAHADLAAHRERRLRALYLRASHAHLRRTYSVADRIVVQSPALAELLAREFGVQGERVAIIPNGVDPSIAVARPREELGWSAAEVVLVYAGTLDEAHDLEPLLRAMAAVERADLRLVIHGSGPCEARWRELAGAAVSFLPPVPRDALLGRLLAADVGVAVYGERAFDHGRFLFSSLKVEEYRAAGLFTVVTTGAVPRARLDERLVEVGNSAVAWQELLRALPARSALPPRCRAHTLTWDDVARCYQQLIDGALGGDQDLTGAPASTEKPTVGGQP